MENEMTEVATNLEVPAPVSDTPVETTGTAMRAMADIQKEYDQIVSACGDLQYRITIMQEQLSQLNSRLKVINNEAAQVHALEESRKARHEAEKIAAAQAKRDRKAGAPTEVASDVPTA